MKNKKIILLTDIFIVITITLLMVLIILAYKPQEKQQPIKPLHTKQFTLSQKYLVDNPDSDIVSHQITKKQNKQKEVDSDFKYYSQVDLNKTTQKFTYKQSQKYDIDYELALSVMKVESDFDAKAISYNGSSVGLFQINRYNTLNWLADEVGIDELNPKNPYQSIKMGTWYLHYLKQYWLNRGLSESHAQKAALISYHRGLGASKSYIRNYGYNSVYVNKIFNYKNKLEAN